MSLPVSVWIALVARVGARGKTLAADALNDYSAEIPIDDGARNGALVAYFLDGKPMLASDRGPLWIIYPFSARPELRTETFYVRSIWNLFELTVCTECSVAGGRRVPMRHCCVAGVRFSPPASSCW